MALSSSPRGRPGSSPTLSDVARAAGVSLATASRALNGSVGRTVRADLSERVLAAADQLGYSVNAQAQAMARGSSSSIALLVGDIADPYFGAVAAGVMAAAAADGLAVFITPVGRDPELQAQTVRGLAGQRPRAVIRAVSAFIDPASERAIQAELARIAEGGAGVSLVLSAAPVGQADASASTRAAGPLGSIVVDNRGGADLLATTLVDLGYREFVVLVGDEALVTARERAGGFMDALARVGLEIQPAGLVPSPLSRDGGFQAMGDVLAAGHRPQCVFAVTDAMAIGAMAALREHGLTPGRDVAVAGFDDLQIARDVTPALTTVSLPFERMGALALAAALSAEPTGSTEDGSLAPARISGRVVVRESTPAR